MAAARVTSFKKAKQAKADRLKYTAATVAPLVMQAFDDFAHRAKRETKQDTADFERKNRKRL